MSAGDTQPTRPLGDAHATFPIGETAPPPRRRRRVWPWIVALVVVVGLLVAAWFIAERVARDIVESTIRTQITSNLDLPADHEIEVDIPGQIVPQLLGGKIDEVRIASDDVSFEGTAPNGETVTITADVSVEAFAVPIRGGDMTGANGELRMDAEQLRALTAAIPDVTIDQLAIEAPDISASTELQLFGVTVPIGIALTPSAADGQLLLTPSRLQLAGADIGAADLKDRFGGLVDGVVRDWPVCIAQYVPAGLTLTDVAVEDDELVARFDIADGMLSDPALQQKGSC